MKFELLVLSLIFVRLTLKAKVSAEVTIGTYADPSHPGQCVLQQLVLSPGAVAKHPEMCAKITCHDNSKASIVTCATMIPPEGCTVGEPVDPEANYPNCCRKKIICKNGLVFNS
ncbi:uncharacterized protein LOC119603974 [Lucilia sericata]|uniref:uncharacterized protein LOC119603974 n=1 Tax=Lucilia sericata TaxID=13632 RepID=UPI0018A7FD8C|nr:uncharacterized protein LOC119603974 [Lucilia sericata]